MQALAAFWGFAGGASLLVGAFLTVLASTMLLEVYEEGAAVVGVVTTLGFLAGFVLSHLEQGGSLCRIRMYAR